jgi:alpha-1,3/alpha-1,6-mannosyltransferase
VLSGGAERLVLDAVLELQAAGHDVQLYTAHHDTRRCFAETLQPGTHGVCMRRGR